MAEYICKKGFVLEKYDDDGFVTEDCIDVLEGNVYHKVDRPLFIAAIPAIRLEDDSGNWMEIQPESLAEYFSEAALSEGGTEDG